MSIKSWFRSAGKTEAKTDQSRSSDKTLPPPKSTTISLDEISLGMQHAATAANRLIAHQYMQALEPFFDQTSDGLLQPKTVEMALDDNHYFKLPLVALATPRGLMLERMKVYLTVCTESIDNQLAQPIAGEEHLNRFIVSLSPSSKHDHEQRRDCSHVDIEMEFATLEPPESVMRLIDEYTRQMSPIPNNGA